MYALDGKHVQDLVLGLRVKSELTDPMAVLLTVSQNRFLLNALRGDGFLNMRLTDQEAQEARRDRPSRAECSRRASSPTPCVLELGADRRLLLCGTSRRVPAGAVEGIARSGRGCRKDSSCSAFRRRT